jgi:hypothetical protein
MIGVTHGLVVMKKCFHCGKVSTCFCPHDKLPLEGSHEDNHFWNFVEGDPAVHFDLKCGKCGKVVLMKELVGLMICTGCDPECQVDAVRREVEPQDVQVCIALGRRPIDERKQIPPEKAAAIQQYFDRRVQSGNTRTKVVSHHLVRSIERCYAKVIEDAEALAAVPSRKK